MTQAATTRHDVNSAALGTAAAVAAGGFRDAAGQAVFSDGEFGAVHVLAHQLYDRGQSALGRAWLGRWLDARAGSGSDWVHLHFHLALFELADGDWDAAYARFCEHILPIAAASENALTDAPALLWRLRLAAPRPIALPWEPLRHRALQHIEQARDPFVALHDLLALAGAGDLESLDRWVRARPDCDGLQPECVLRRIALVLRAYARRAFRSAGKSLERLLPELRVLGGSLAQQQLFAELARSIRGLA